MARRKGQKRAASNGKVPKPNKRSIGLSTEPPESPKERVFRTRYITETGDVAGPTLHVYFSLDTGEYIGHQINGGNRSTNYGDLEPHIRYMASQKERTQMDESPDGFTGVLGSWLKRCIEPDSDTRKILDALRTTKAEESPAKDDGTGKVYVL